jgi:bisphosphoglycerate-independent phosphoglycerate mutase (AlkP superfamily)
MDEIGLGVIVTTIGRGIALDRDGNYDRTEKAFNALTSDYGHKVNIRVV